MMYFEPIHEIISSRSSIMRPSVLFVDYRHTVRSDATEYGVWSDFLLYAFKLGPNSREK